MRTPHLTLTPEQVTYLTGLSLDQLAATYVVGGGQLVQAQARAVADHGLRLPALSGMNPGRGGLLQRLFRASRQE